MRRRCGRRRGRPRRLLPPAVTAVLFLTAGAGRRVVVPSSHVGFIASVSASASASTASASRRLTRRPPALMMTTRGGCRMIRRMMTTEEWAAAAFVGASSTATVPSRFPKLAAKVAATTPSLRHAFGLAAEEESSRRNRNHKPLNLVVPGGGPPLLGSASSGVVVLAADGSSEEAAAIDDDDDEWRELANALLDLSDRDDEGDRRGIGEGGTTRARAKKTVTSSGDGCGGDHRHQGGSTVAGASSHVAEDHHPTDGMDDDGIRERRRRTDTLRGGENAMRNGKGREKDAPRPSGGGARGGGEKGENNDDDDNERRHWDLVRFNMDLDALARKGTVDSAEKAERILFGRLRDHRHDGGGGGDDGFVGVDVISFNTVLKGWAKCGGDTGAERAEALLGRMEYLSSSTSSSSSPLLPFRPNEVSYGTVVDAWARCGRVDGAREAERVLRRLREEAEGADALGEVVVPTTLPRPNARMYASVANGYGWRGQAEEALALLRRMTSPESDIYASVIDAFANSGGGTRAAEEAEGLLREMEEGKDEGDNDGPPPPPRPDVVCYTNAIKAWARSGNPNAGERAEGILRRMWPSGWGGLDPSPNSDSDSDADVDVDVNVAVVPNAVTVTAAMNAWANAAAAAGDDDPNARAAPRRIAGLLRRMELLHARRRGRDDATRPDHVVYSTAVTAWARSPEPGGAVRAEAVLRGMVDACADFVARGDADVTNSLRRCFGVVIGAHLRSKEDGSLRRAVNVLLWMIYVGVEPDECLFRTFFRGFAEATELGQVDVHDVDEMVEEVLDICLKDGVLDDGTKTSFKKIAMREFFER